MRISCKGSDVVPLPSSSSQVSARRGMTSPAMNY